MFEICSYNCDTCTSDPRLFLLGGIYILYAQIQVTGRSLHRGSISVAVLTRDTSTQGCRVSCPSSLCFNVLVCNKDSQSVYDQQDRTHSSSRYMQNLLISLSTSI